MIYFLKSKLNLLLIISRFLISKIRFIFKISNEKDFLTELKKNLSFKNVFINNEAIIFGNGPSTNNFDFNKIGNRNTFTVNYSTRGELKKKLISDFHVWADMGAFYLNEKVTIESIRSQLTHTSKAIFLPIESKKFILNHGIISNLIHYYYSNTNLYEGGSIKDNLASNIHGFSNVVHWAIVFAIYMGFKKIYLVGVENTNIVIFINIQLETKIVDGHSYAYTENDITLFKKKASISSMEAIFEGTYLNLKHYRIIYEEAKKMGVDIINLTEKTLIDSIPKGKISDLK